MWIFTRYGFYSIASASMPDGSIDAQSVMVRARRIAHLRKLQKRFDALAAGEILIWANRDYRYRFIISKASWIAIMGEMGQEQEWSNFKDEAAKYQGASGGEYVRALYDVWSAMSRLQRSEDRPHRGSADS